VSVLPYMPFYVHDYEDATGELTTLQHGIYFGLLRLAWKRKGSIPNDIDFIRRSFPDLHGRTWNAFGLPVLHRFFELGEDGCWHNKRMSQEVAKASQLSRNRSETALKRWRNGAETEVKPDHVSNETKDLADANAMPARATGQVIRKKEDTIAKAIGANAPKPGGNGVAQNRPIDRVWWEGVPAIENLTGLANSTCRGIIGRWVNKTGKDPGQILDLITECQNVSPADPIRWVEARLKPPRKSGTSEIHDAIQKLRQPH
jgi:uncharacterized protein YdaU (DUF1376 family)